MHWQPEFTGRFCSNTQGQVSPCGVSDLVGLVVEGHVLAFTHKLPSDTDASGPGVRLTESLSVSCNKCLKKSLIKSKSRPFQTEISEKCLK